MRTRRHTSLHSILGGVISVMMLITFSLTASAQSDYFVITNSIVLSNTGESILSSYTISTNGVNDGGSGTSLVTSGTICEVVFPTGTNATTCTGGQIIILGTTYPITSYATSSSINYMTFILPANLPAQTGFVLTLNSIRNPPINPACGASTNTYSTTFPCDEPFYLLFPNQTFSSVFLSGYNIYHHFGDPQYSIQAQPYFVMETTEVKHNLSKVFSGALEEDVVAVNVRIAGSTGSLPTLTSLTFNTTGTSTIGSILEARVYSTGNEDFFHSHNDILLTSTPNPGLSVSFAGSFTLQPGDNYFFMSYNVACDPLFNGQTLDGNFVSATINGSPVTSTTNPTGGRVIQPNYSIFNPPNLVPNSSAETFATCPANWYGAALSFPTNGVPGWQSPTFGTPSAGAGTSDYFNTCASAATVGVPQNFGGYQVARTGNAYLGAGFFGHPNTEYVQIQLTSPLTSGVEYALTFFVSIGENVTTKKNGIGAFLSTSAAPPNSGAFLPFTPVLVEPNIIRDEVDWYPISGTFVATGNEQWLVIGHFLNSASTQIIDANGPQTASGSYTYIDDVSLVPLTSVISCNTILLASELDHFEAIPKTDGSVQLEWDILSESDVMRYEIYTSRDAQNWVFNQSVASIGDHNSLHQYITTDTPDVPSIYYQLVERTMNGDSKVLAQDYVLRTNPVRIVLVPNPSSQHLTIRLPEGEIRSVQILTMDGKEMATWSISGNVLDISALDDGQYILVIEDSQHDRIIERFIKN